jgi:tetratricopeptide (TPR) repeat protein/predicted Ser/Thr protein kinase
MDRLEHLQTALAGRYAIEGELGRGGMALVFRARDLRHDRPVALKVVRSELASVVGRERFLREIQVAAKLQHANIVPVHDSGETAGTLYYVMPFVEGESLRSRLNREGQLPIEDALEIARDVASALSYAHERGIVHRDIKPENILLSGGHALVADFGIARAFGAGADARLTETGLAIGTPAYMSPEQVTGSRTLDGRSDIYSLGCVLYETLAGEPPFTGPSPQAVIARRFVEPPAPLRRLRPAVPPAVGAAVARALASEPGDRFPTAAEFARALSPASLTAPASPRTAPAEPPTVVAPAQSQGRRRRPSRRVLWLGLALLVALGAASAALLSRLRTPRTALDADLVAVAPFDVLDPGLTLWHEGLVDVLSRDLDGAGPLRTVSPTVIIRRWRGHADPSSAQTLGHETGAGLAVYGSVVRSGSDSVRLAATVLEVASQRRLGDIEVRGGLGHMDQLVDSLAVGLLRELGRTRPVGVVRQTGLGARSLPALRAFLQAEQYYRRGLWDSAQVYAEQAVEIDTAFALAYKRLAQARGWDPGAAGGESLSNIYTMRAAALNHGLAPRDSLLVLAESLFRPVSAGGFGAPANPALAARGLATLEEAVRRYPEDPEAWYALGEVRHHFAGWLLITGGWRATLEAFERSIALDSLFVPAYIHPVELSYGLGDTAGGRRFAEVVIRHNPRSVQGRGLQVLSQFLALRDSTAQARLVDSLPGDVLWEADEPLARWADSAELGVRFWRYRLLAPASDEDARLTRRSILADKLAFRGHLREALALGDTLWHLVFAEAALLGYVPVERATATFSAWLRRSTPFESVVALPWWAARGDTVALRRFLHLADSAARAPRSPADSFWAPPMAAFARAHLTLARHDTTAALRLYDSLLAAPTATPWLCQSDRLFAVRLLADHGRLTQAARTVNAAPTMEGEIGPRPSDVLWYLERGRVAERLNDRPRALEAYRSVAAAWRHPDPELEPYVTEAHEALKRLTAEPRR